MEAVGSLVSTLGQLVGEEYRVLSGVGAQVAELMDELASMNAILRMQSEADDSTVDHFVREWMKQVRYLAYDAEDCADIYIFRVQCRLKEVGFVVWSKRLLVTLFSRHRLAGKIQAFRARAVAISERHVRYSASREALISRSASTPVGLEPAQPVMSVPSLHSTEAHEFIGGQARVLACEVTASDHSHSEDDAMKLKVFSIVGVSGSGKSALATEVCRLLEAEFHVQAHVSVSSTFDASKDLKTLLQRVLLKIVNVKGSPDQGIKEVHSLTHAQMDQMSVEDLTWRLKEILKDKRYLIVFDDLWTTAAWAAIQSELPEDNCGSRVLVTTPVETVARACSHGSLSRNYIYNISPLSVDDSKKLFLSHVFGFMNPPSYCPKELENEMDEILRKCAGLPMDIIGTATYLANCKPLWSKHMWVIVSRSIRSQMESANSLEGMRKIVTLSYYHLPYYLRGCMIYLSFFPEDYTISKVRILWRWITEGLVEEKMGFTLVEVAEQYFEELVSRSMIDLSGNVIMTHGNKEKFNIGAMMLEIMVSKALEENYVSIIGSQYAGKSYHRARRLSIHGEQGWTNSSSNGDYRSGIEGMNLKYVRSLSIFHVERKKLFDRLGEFTLLRVLDLEDCKGLENKHMLAICRMYLLRFLGLKGTDISEVPREISDLEHLQNLDLYQTRISELPETVTKLKKVERLLFSNKEPGTICKAPRELSKMKALREVSDLVIDTVWSAQEIGKLQDLQAIDVYVNGRSQHKEEDRKVRQELVRSLGKTYSLLSLNVVDIVDEGCTLDYLMDLDSPPVLLRYLRISGGISRLPDWVGWLEYLVEFAISDTKLCDDKLLGVLCKAPKLQRVLCDNSFYSGHELVARSTDKFPALKVMWVPSSDEWPKVFEFEEDSMRTLENLELNFGGNREKSIVGIEHLTNIKEVKLRGEKGNPALNIALEQLEAEYKRRPVYSQFRLLVTYA